MSRRAAHGPVAGLGSLLAVSMLVACGTTAPRVGSPSPAAGAASGELPGVEIYVPIAHVSEFRFLVIEVLARAYGDDSFDYWLRDALLAAGFPEGITRAQLARRMVEAGMADNAYSTTDLIALRQFARVAGPFLRLRVEYDVGSWGGATYRVELWDVSTATLVYSARGKKLIIWKLADEMGPKIVDGLRTWREASLVVQREAAAAKSAT